MQPSHSHSHSHSHSQSQETITVAELAHILQVKPQMIYTYWRTNRLPFAPVTPTSPRSLSRPPWPRKEALEWADAHINQRQARQARIQTQIQQQLKGF